MPDTRRFPVADAGDQCDMVEDEREQEHEQEKQLPYEGEPAGGEEDGPQPWAKTSSGEADDM